VQAAQIAAEQRADSGYYVGQGCAIGVSGTAGKLSITAGTVIVGTTDLAVAAASAITGTDSSHDDITELADATNPKWVVVELDSSGISYNQGTAAATPAIPAFTASRVPLALLYIPAAATNSTTIDSLLTTANGNVKLVSIAVTRLGPTATGWQYDQDTWTYEGGGMAGWLFSTTNNPTTYLPPGTKVSFNDGSVKYGVVAHSSFSPATPLTSVSSSSTPSSDSKLNKTAHGLNNGDVVTLSGVSGTTGIANSTNYYVVTVTANAFQLSNTLRGAAITLGGTQDTGITVTGVKAVTLIPNATYTMSNATLVRPRFSYQDNPQAGSFDWIFTWTPTLSGWSAAPTGNFYRFSTSGTKITLFIAQGTGGAGTSNNATHTASLPVNPKLLSFMLWMNPCYAIDNGTNQTGLLRIASGATVIGLNGIIASANNTSSGSSAILGGQITYEFA